MHVYVRAAFCMRVGGRLQLCLAGLISAPGEIETRLSSGPQRLTLPLVKTRGFMLCTREIADLHSFAAALLYECILIGRRNPRGLCV